MLTRQINPHLPSHSLLPLPKWGGVGGRLIFFLCLSGPVPPSQSSSAGRYVQRRGRKGGRATEGQGRAGQQGITTTATTTSGQAAGEVSATAMKKTTTTKRRGRERKKEEDGEKRSQGGLGCLFLSLHSPSPVLSLLSA